MMIELTRDQMEIANINRPEIQSLIVSVRHMYNTTVYISLQKEREDEETGWVASKKATKRNSIDMSDLDSRY